MPEARVRSGAGESLPAPLLEVSALAVDYRGRRRRTFRAVEGIDIRIDQGETLGLVGESGSGKTTIGRAVQGLVTPSAGRVRIDGREVRPGGARQRRALAADVQTVFQDPFGSLNPARSIGATLEETLLVQERHLSRADVERRIRSELERVGLPGGAAQRLPREFSGGQRQRIAIARALIARPRLVICDEAVSALDLSIQAQILNLLLDLQLERGVSYLFITHDLAVVQHVATRITVLQRGRIVDSFPARQADPAAWSAYTRKLFDAAPVPDPSRQRAKRAAFEALRSQERADAGGGP